MVNIPPVGFIGGPSKQVRKENIQGEWDPGISVAVVTAMGVPVEEALSGILMNDSKVVIHLECDGKKEFLKSLEEGCRTHSVDQ